MSKKLYERRVVVAQQVLNPKGIGGVSAEFNGLSNSKLSERGYQFVPVVLDNCHKGINLFDIRFYEKRFREIRPDIIHIRGAAPDGLNAAIAAKLYGKAKILVTVHGMYSDLVFISRIKRFISKNIIERSIFQLSDGISCVCKSASERPYFKKWRSKMLPFVYNRMPVIAKTGKTRSQLRAELGLPEHSVIGVYVGRITREKGMDVLTDTFCLMSEKWPKELHFLIVGDGDYRKQMQDRVSELAVSSHVLFTGAKENVSPFLLASDFFVMPSLHENHSIALLEAVSATLPCVVTDVGGNSEIVSNLKTGLLVERSNASQLAIAIEKMAGDNRLRTTLKMNIENSDYSVFSNNAIDDRLDCVYKEILTK